jgi:uncharacterized protein (TIGR02453 family)
MPVAVQDARFSPDFMKFFKEIRTHNDKEWFTANKVRYERVVKGPSLAFVAAAGPHLQKISKAIVADPRPVGGSVARIYRDTRFSKDKSPYKTHAAIMFSNRDNSDESGHLPGFYLHLEPGDSSVWAGVWQPAPELLKRIRDAIVADPKGWKRAKSAHNAADHGESLKRVPSGYDPEHPFAEDLKRKDFLAGRVLKDSEVTSPAFLQTFIAECRLLAPYNAFLSKAMGTGW